MKSKSTGSPESIAPFCSGCKIRPPELEYFLASLSLLLVKEAPSRDREREAGARVSLPSSHLNLTAQLKWAQMQKRRINVSKRPRPLYYCQSQPFILNYVLAFHRALNNFRKRQGFAFSLTFPNLGSFLLLQRAPASLYCIFLKKYL